MAQIIPNIVTPICNYRNVSVVSIVHMRCGAFKYQEMVLSDMNRESENFIEYLNNRNLDTESIAEFSSNDIGDDINNIYIIRHADYSPNIKNELCYCDTQGLLLNSNTTLFELATLTSIDRFHPPFLSLNSLMINYDFTSSRQCAVLLDGLFLKYKAIKTTIIIVDTAFRCIKYVNVTLKTKYSYKSLELKSIDDKKLSSIPKMCNRLYTRQ